jgi:hypothetical protein
VPSDGYGPETLDTSSDAAARPAGPGRRLRWAVVGVAVLVVAALVAVLVVVVTGRSDGSNSAQSGRPGKGARAPVSAQRDISVRQGPQPPDDGAYLGAAVQKDDFTEQGRFTSVSDFERALGRKLAIVHVYHQWNDPFPSEADRAFVARGQLLLLSWAGTDTRSIVTGHDDAMIRERALALKALGKPVLLEWRWEMDRPNLQAEVWSPRDYIAAWDHIQDVFSAVGATNVGWVWCPTAEGFRGGHAAAYYPGDSRVDWLCADAYPPSGLPSLQSLLRPFLLWARSHPRPVIIGEYGALEGAPGARARWLRQAASDLARDTQVRAAVYFDIDSVNGGRIFPWSIDTSPSSFAAFREMSRNSHFSPMP